MASEAADRSAGRSVHHGGDAATAALFCASGCLLGLAGRRLFRCIDDAFTRASRSLISLEICAKFLTGAKWKLRPVRISDRRLNLRPHLRTFASQGAPRQSCPAEIAILEPFWLSRPRPDQSLGSVSSTSIAAGPPRDGAATNSVWSSAEKSPVRAPPAVATLTGLEPAVVGRTSTWPAPQTT